MAPSLTGRGWGWVVSSAAEAVSRFPGPPLEDPPTSPPRNSTEARGGARWDDWRTGCPLPTGGAASRPMCQLAWRSGCSAADRTITSSGGSAADVTQSAATGAAVEPLIAGLQRRSRCGHFFAPGFQRSGSGHGGCPGWRSERASTERSDLRARTDRQAGVGHAQHDGQRSPRSPGTGKGPPRASAGSAGLTVLRQGWTPVRGETPVPWWLDAQRDSPARRSGETPGPKEPWQQRHRRHPRLQRLQHSQIRPRQQRTRSPE